MAAAKNVAHVAVAARGLALLSLIAASTDPAPGVMLLTQEEGAEAVNAGYAVIDPAVPATVPGTAAVRLTEAGTAQLTQQGATASGSKFEIEDNVPMPEGIGRKAPPADAYPFAALEVNQSFHVPATTENPNPAERLASSITAARAKYAVEIPGQFKSVKITEYKKGADGKYELDAAGKRQNIGQRTEQRPATKLTRDFKVAAVDASDPKGKGARVWRVALDPATAAL